MTTTTLIVNDQQQLQKQALKKLDELILHQKQWCSKQRNPSPSEEREREKIHFPTKGCTHCSILKWCSGCSLYASSLESDALGEILFLAKVLSWISVGRRRFCLKIGKKEVSTWLDYTWRLCILPRTLILGFILETRIERGRPDASFKNSMYTSTKIVVS